MGGCLREEDLSFSGSGLQNDTLLRADRLLSDFSVDLADFPPTNINVAYLKRTKKKGSSLVLRLFSM